MKMEGLAELRAGARKAAIDILIGAATAAATELVLQAIRGEKAQEPVPVRIEVVLPVQKAAPDTVIALQDALGKKRFPARPMQAAVPAAQKKPAPALMR